MTLRSRRVLHMRLSRGGSMYGDEILAPDGTVVGSITSSRETSREKFSTVYRLGEEEFASAAELIKAYEDRLKKAEQDRRDKEWEDAKP